MSELTEEQIKQAKREQMLQNLERGRKVRAENLKLAKQRNLKRNVESKEKESPKDTLEDKKSNEKETTTPKTKTPPTISNFVCVCGKKLTTKATLKRHEGICRFYQEKTNEFGEIVEKTDDNVKVDIEPKIVEQEAVKSDDEDVEIQVIKRKKPKKKKVVVVEEEESSDEEPAPKNVIIKQAPKPPKVEKQETHIPKKSIVPSAHNKHTHLQPDHFEKEERYTIAQFRAIVERENKKKQEKAIQDKRLKEDMRLKSIIENMRNGGI